MISLFRRLSPANVVILIVVAILLRIGVFFKLPETLPLSFAEPFSWLLMSTEPLTFSPFVNVAIAAILVLIQAFIFNAVINEFNLLGKPTQLPALMYVTVSALFAPFLIITPPLICNFLLIWMISKFLSIYRRNDALPVMFDLSMMAAIGSLIYFPFIAMMPLIWLSLLIFRPFNWREWTATLIGFATIYFFLAVYYYWNDSLDKFYTIWLPLANPFVASFTITYGYIVLVPVIIILLLSVFSLQQNFFRSFVHVRKSLQLLFFMLVLALVSFYIKPESRLPHFILGVAPASVFMAYYFLNAKVRWFYESLYLILAGTIIYFQIA
ncbi:MAG: beta-carotene 15,15-monooxygenase [Sphingobacteriaceae bacterium]|jgi:hypothetical protein|nr:beta-carotene 15,15-monooxygenase [Sphingobacteriaceae bacterium]